MNPKGSFKRQMFGFSKVQTNIFAKEYNRKFLELPEIEFINSQVKLVCSSLQTLSSQALHNGFEHRGGSKNPVIFEPCVVQTCNSPPACGADKSILVQISHVIHHFYDLFELLSTMQLLK